MNSPLRAPLDLINPPVQPWSQHLPVVLCVVALLPLSVGPVPLFALAQLSLSVGLVRVVALALGFRGRGLGGALFGAELPRVARVEVKEEILKARQGREPPFRSLTHGVVKIRCIWTPGSASKSPLMEGYWLFFVRI